MKSQRKIFIAGHAGMVGSAILRQLKVDSNVQILKKSRQELDLLDQNSVNNFMQLECPDEVYVCAAKVGGIVANNNFPADFIYNNLMIEANLIHSSFKAGVKKLVFLGSSCIYPKFADQPIKEESLLAGYLESTNEPYAIAKIAGIKLCESYNRQYGSSHGIDYRSVMPCNLYGVGDNYHPENSHVIPGLIRKFHLAKMRNESQVSVWGTGEPRREFLYVDDLADACIKVMNADKSELDKITTPMCNQINVGAGYDISIADLAILIKSVVGYSGKITYDASKPDGTERKLIDSSKIRLLGWVPSTQLQQGLKVAYDDFVRQNQA